MNWALKIAAKLVLSRLPLSYGFLRSLGMFRHGYMNEPGYAVRIFKNHMNRVGGPEAFSGKVCLELGPGDSLASAILAHAMGARKTFLIDVGAFAEPRATVYEEVIDELAAEGCPVADLRGFSSLEDLLERTGAVYLTNGMDSLRSIPTGSVDIIWSQAVLEHIRVRQLPALLGELRRILSDTGTMSHRIDYKDHLDRSLNNLRFPTRIWEAEAMARSGFYTNRIRNTEFLGLIEAAGFELTDVHLDYWPEVPLPRRKLAKEFQSLSDEDLRTRGATVVAKIART